MMIGTNKLGKPLIRIAEIFQQDVPNSGNYDLYILENRHLNSSVIDDLKFITVTIR